ncbi:MAG TPA: GntR family transcriptional regulator [Pseudonocardia sp.]|uniref:FadR/GntR family transcriptional regulator n=1 Tax=Pseudonocardia sp. TaxID=60912 RepID=UPI002ED81C6D
MDTGQVRGDKPDHQRVAAGDGPRAGQNEVVFRPAPPLRTFDAIIRQIRAMIEDGRLRPGDRLPSERTLAEQFEVSRNTVREALRMLEISGLITLKRGHTGGSFIAAGDASVVANSLADALQLTDFTLEHVVESLRGIASMAAVAACERMTDDDLAELDANVRRAAELTEAGRWEDKVTTHLEFHHILAKATGNPILVLIMQTLLEVVGKVTISRGPTRDDTIARSRRILLKALRARDPDAAVRELARYFDHVQRMWLASADADRHSEGAAARELGGR